MSHCSIMRGTIHCNLFCPLLFLVNQQSKYFTALCLPNYFIYFMVDIFYGMCVLFCFIASIKKTGLGVSLIPSVFPFICEYYKTQCTIDSCISHLYSDFKTSLLERICLLPFQLFPVKGWFYVCLSVSYVFYLFITTIYLFI